MRTLAVVIISLIVLLPASGHATLSEAVVAIMEQVGAVGDSCEEEPAASQYIMLLTVEQELVGMKYLTDPDGGDIYHTPDEMKRRGGGDCEDLAGYVLTRMREMGEPKQTLGLCAIVSPGSAMGHIAAMILDERGYQWIVVDWFGSQDKPVIRLVPLAKYIKRSLDVAGDSSFILVFGMVRDALTVWKGYEGGKQTTHYILPLSLLLSLKP